MFIYYNYYMYLLCYLLQYIMKKDSIYIFSILLNRKNYKNNSLLFKKLIHDYYNASWQIENKRSPDSEKEEK